MKLRQEIQWTEIIAQCGIGGYREYRIPGLLPINNGALLLTMEARRENMGDWGDIDIHVLRRENDSSLMRVLSIGESDLVPNGRMRTYNNPVLVPDKEKVHLLYHKNYERAFITTSSDGGLSWSNSREITTVYKDFSFQWNVCASGPGHGIRLHSGRLLVPIWLANGMLSEDGLTREHWPSAAAYIFSDDHAASWQAGSLIGGIVNGNETSVVELADNRLLFNIRNMTAKCRALAISSENGSSLSSAWLEKTLPDPWCFGGMAGIPSGALFVNCASEKRRKSLTITSTKDGGKTWKTEVVVDDFGGYADIAVSSREVIVFYERYSYKERIVKELVLRSFLIEK